MKDINPVSIEEKWQKIWDEQGLYEVDLEESEKEKYYNLVMFPYPSGDKLHIGHWYNYGGADAWGRYMKMKGFNVLQPMGFDAFGLPAENYAIKTGVHPTISIKQNVEYMIKQLKRIGCMYDWDKMVNTSTPDYYKWTQWLFLQMYKNGLAYRKNASVNYCPSCQTVLANEQVWDGKCERCKSEVVPKKLEQWFWQTTKYAQKLLDNLPDLDWPEKTKLMQQNWIGRSEGITYKQKIKDLNVEVTAFDSVPQTFMAQTFAVIAPEHDLVPKLVEGTEHEKAVLEFVKEIKKKKLANKFDVENDIEGIFTGRYIENPFGTGDLPIWVASFVLVDYGSGIVNCSVHDERDFAFAKKYDIPLRAAMLPEDSVEAEKVKNLEYCYHNAPDGVMLAPEEFKGKRWGEVREGIIKYVEKKGWGKKTVNYKLKDWLVSRQRYWGAPIPIVYCEKCGPVPVPEKDLPVVLPEEVEYKPTGGEVAPLGTSEEFVNTKCPECGGKARREVDTMDTFVCSSWYYLRYLDAHNEQKPWNEKVVKEWMPVDMYIGGPEHACMHLIYARFVMMALHDFGFTSHDEPFKRLVHQGLVTKDGAKMSKSKGNVVSPDEFVDKYGSDVFRMYLMFMGPFEDGGDWSDQGITGVARFYNRFHKLLTDKIEVIDEKRMNFVLHSTIKRVTQSINSFNFNTAISALMEATNSLFKIGLNKEASAILCKLSAPLAPHLAEEIWQKLGEKESIFLATWPEYNEDLIVEDTIEIAIQINGKIRGTAQMPAGIENDAAFAAALDVENVKKYVEGKEIIKKIYVPGKLVSFVVKE